MSGRLVDLLGLFGLDSSVIDSGLIAKSDPKNSSLAVRQRKSIEYLRAALHNLK